MPPANEKPAQEEKPFNVSALQTQKAQAVRLADKAKRDPALRKILVAAKSATAEIDSLKSEVEKLNGALAASEAKVIDLAGKLDEAVTSAAHGAKTSAEALAGLRVELEKSQKYAAASDETIKQLDGEATKLRKDLAAALKKTAVAPAPADKPAGS